MSKHQMYIPGARRVGGGSPPRAPAIHVSAYIQLSWRIDRVSQSEEGDLAPLSRVEGRVSLRNVNGWIFQSAITQEEGAGMLGSVIEVKSYSQWFMSR